MKKAIKLNMELANGKEKPEFVGLTTEGDSPVFRNCKRNQQN